MSTRAKSCFVFAVVGSRHVETAATAIRFLKRCTRHEIIAVTSRSDAVLAHDQVIAVELPETLDDHQASIELKTSLLDYVRGAGDRFCYLDSDVIAVGPEVDTVFDHLRGPVAFAHDHATIDAFSSWAVNCGCREPRCNHLREALLCTFEIDVHRCDWRMWNGGVFVFDEGSEDFLRSWNAMTRQIMRDPYWRTRDQGTLAATAWKMGLHDNPVLPGQFNFIVDCMAGVASSLRPTLPPSLSRVRTDYALTGPEAPQFLHFVNGGVGRRGWRNWDDVERLLAGEIAA